MLGLLYAIISSGFILTTSAVTLATEFHQLKSNSNLRPRVASSAQDFDWNKLKPTPDLKWVDCFTGRQCARLEVPLDYNNPNGDKAAVALLRIQAKVNNSGEYRGPVLFNPGGPGGSGVAFINSEVGDSFQQILGGNFDIVGFDPRGIGETTPAVSIFPDEIERAYWDAGAPPLLNSTEDALPQSFSRAELFNELVELRSERAAQHVGTSVVARDMLSITKAHGRDKLQYWGFSYGTVLGATYAAMFPNNIERLIIDGVVDFEDYYTGKWLKNLLDTDKTLQYLCDQCAKAGPTCPLYASSGSAVRKRIDRILNSLKSNPVRAVNGTDYALINFSDVKDGLLATLYSPFSVFPPVAQALAALEQGDGRPVLALLRTVRPLPKCDTPVPLGSPRQEATLAVACGDGEISPKSTLEISEHFERLSRISTFADVWTDGTFTSCAGWSVRPSERFTGSFSVNTSFPLLIIGNTMDPVTPLAGAQKAERGFGGSVLLTIDTPGHSSLAATSTCTLKAVRDYFLYGKLPDKGTVCDIQDVLFSGKPVPPQNMSVGGPELFEAAWTLQNYHSSRGSRLL